MCNDSTFIYPSLYKFIYPHFFHIVFSRYVYTIIIICIYVRQTFPDVSRKERKANSRKVPQNLIQCSSIKTLRNFACSLLRPLREKIRVTIGLMTDYENITVINYGRDQSIDWQKGY